MVENNNSDRTEQENVDDSQKCWTSSSGDSACCSSDPGSSKMKMVVFIIIVVAAGVVLTRSILRKSNSDLTQSQQAFASIQTETLTIVDESKKQGNSVKAVSSLWQADLDSLASLNTVAAEVDVVFVLLAAKDNLNDQAITKEIEAAAQKIMANGKKVTAFRLKESAPDYANLAKQVSVPSVLAMVKGLGMSAVSGEISETKLIQAFVTASRSSGCGPSSGCSPSSCPPAGPGK